jgi:TolB protein
MNADGTEFFNVTRNANMQSMHPDWSPGGRRIGFEGRVGSAAWDIYVINVDGTGRSNLTNNPANDGNIAWSPDGSRIAFVSDRDGNFEIYVMNSDGSEPVRLTTNDGIDAFPAWSPDGTQIAFRSDRGENSDVYVMNADGTNLRRLTTHEAIDTQPSWSSDGARIVFATNRAPDSADVNEQNFDIYVINSDGSELTQITDDPSSERYPDWYPQAEPQVGRVE